MNSIEFEEATLMGAVDGGAPAEYIREKLFSVVSLCHTHAQCALRVNDFVQCYSLLCKAEALMRAEDADLASALSQTAAQLDEDIEADRLRRKTYQLLGQFERKRCTNQPPAKILSSTSDAPWNPRRQKERQGSASSAVSEDKLEDFFDESDPEDNIMRVEVKAADDHLLEGHAVEAVPDSVREGIQQASNKYKCAHPPVPPRAQAKERFRNTGTDWKERGDAAMKKVAVLQQRALRHAIAVAERDSRREEMRQKRKEQWGKDYAERMSRVRSTLSSEEAKRQKIIDNERRMKVLRAQQREQHKAAELERITQTLQQDAVNRQAKREQQKAQQQHSIATRGEYTRMLKSDNAARSALGVAGQSLPDPLLGGEQPRVKKTGAGGSQPQPALKRRSSLMDILASGSDRVVAEEDLPPSPKPRHRTDEVDESESGATGLQLVDTLGMVVDPAACEGHKIICFAVGRPVEVTASFSDSDDDETTRDKRWFKLIRRGKSLVVAGGEADTSDDSEDMEQGSYGDVPQHPPLKEGHGAAMLPRPPPRGDQPKQKLGGLAVKLPHAPFRSPSACSNEDLRAKQGDEELPVGLATPSPKKAVTVATMTTTTTTTAVDSPPAVLFGRRIQQLKAEAEDPRLVDDDEELPQSMVAKPKSLTVPGMAGAVLRRHSPRSQGAVAKALGHSPSVTSLGSSGRSPRSDGDPLAASAASRRQPQPPANTAMKIRPKPGGRFTTAATRAFRFTTTTTKNRSTEAKHEMMELGLDRSVAAVRIQRVARGMIARTLFTERQLRVVANVVSEADRLDRYYKQDSAVVIITRTLRYHFGRGLRATKRRLLDEAINDRVREEAHQMMLDELAEREEEEQRVAEILRQAEAAKIETERRRSLALRRRAERAVTKIQRFWREWNTSERLPSSDELHRLLHIIRTGGAIASDVAHVGAPRKQIFQPLKRVNVSALAAEKEELATIEEYKKVLAVEEEEERIKAAMAVEQRRVERVALLQRTGRGMADRLRTFVQWSNPVVFSWRKVFVEQQERQQHTRARAQLVAAVVPPRIPTEFQRKEMEMEAMNGSEVNDPYRRTAGSGGTSSSTAGVLPIGCRDFIMTRIFGAEPATTFTQRQKHKEEKESAHAAMIQAFARHALDTRNVRSLYFDNRAGKIQRKWRGVGDTRRKLQEGRDEVRRLSQLCRLVPGLGVNSSNALLLD